MRNIARLSDNDRRELFRNTADKMGLNDAIVEKDFWVCFTLDYLFHRSPWKESITFKGGTSLSKAFHLISRFSEDMGGTGQCAGIGAPGYDGGLSEYLYCHYADRGNVHGLYL